MNLPIYDSFTPEPAMRAGRITSYAIAILVAVACSCRGVPQPIEPRPTLPATNRVVAGQLIFYSDFDLPADHRLIRELVAVRDDICRTLELPYSNEPIHVYLFRDAETYGQYLQQRFPHLPSRRAFFLKTDTRLVVYAHWSDRVAEDLRHEVAHGYLHAAGLELPLWLDEGLAEYFEVPRGHSGLNRPHLELLADMREHERWRPNLARLERLTDAAEMDQRHYAESWAWVYFLLESEPQRRELLIDHLATLRKQGAAPPLSQRLAQRHVEPERTLVEYLVALNDEVNSPTAASQQVGATIK